MEIKQKVEKNRKNIQHTFQVHYAKFQVEANVKHRKSKKNAEEW